MHCMVWHGDMELQARDNIRNRHGLAYMLVINRIPTSLPPARSPWEEEEDDFEGLLQLPPSGDAAVEQDPPHKSTSCETCCRSFTTAVAFSINDQAFVEELRHWGHQVEAILCGSHAKAAVFHPTKAGDPYYHFVFCNEDLTDGEGAFLHSSQTDMSDHDLMKLLYQLGYRRAVILNRDVLNGSLRRMFFKIQTIQMSKRSLRVKEPTPWPLTEPTCK